LNVRMIADDRHLPTGGRMLPPAPQPPCPHRPLPLVSTHPPQPDPGPRDFDRLPIKALVIHTAPSSHSVPPGAPCCMTRAPEDGHHSRPDDSYPLAGSAPVLLVSGSIKAEGRDRERVCSAFVCMGALSAPPQRYHYRPSRDHSSPFRRSLSLLEPAVLD
jgi:hypothetical protein